MKGTFRPGDRLFFKCGNLSAIAPGDVIIFKNACGEDCCREIVHRVVRREAAKYITRGDSAKFVDAAAVTRKSLIGRVYAKERKGRISPVHGGRIGLWRGRMLHVYWGMRRRAVRMIHPLYDRLKASGLIGRIWQPKITRVCVNTRDGRAIQFLYKNRVIARHWPEQGRFECRKPWDLVIKDFSSAAIPGLESRPTS